MKNARLTKKESRWEQRCNVLKKIYYNHYGEQKISLICCNTLTDPFVIHM